MTGGAQTPAAGPRTDRGDAWSRWFPVAAAALAILALAPFLGELRERVRESVGLGYLRWVSGALAAAGAAALVAAVVRIRRLRVRRYGLLLAAGLLVGLQVFAWGTGQEEVDVVERAHLLEYGLLAVLFARAFRAHHDGAALAVLALLGVGLVGLADETVQWLTPVRVGDGRDVLLNLYAGVTGLVFALALWTPMGSHAAVPRRFAAGTGLGGGQLRRALRGAVPTGATGSRPAPRRATFPGATGSHPTAKRSRSARLAAGLGAALVLGGAAFFDAAHLGHEIRDPRGGVFLSWHSPEELVRAGEARARRWSHGGIPPGRPMAVEDVYLSEAGWHANERNHALRAGDLRRAWHENRILERWYGPYLDVRGRWPAEQRAGVRAELEARDPAALDPSPHYRSPVLEGRIVAGPPRSLVWGVALAVSGALAAAGLGRGGRRAVMFSSLKEESS